MALRILVGLALVLTSALGACGGKSEPAESAPAAPPVEMDTIGANFAIPAQPEHLLQMQIGLPRTYPAKKMVEALVSQGTKAVGACVESGKVKLPLKAPMVVAIDIADGRATRAVPKQVSPATDCVAAGFRTLTVPKAEPAKSTVHVKIQRVVQ